DLGEPERLGPDTVPAVVKPSRVPRAVERGDEPQDRALVQAGPGGERREGQALVAGPGRREDRKRAINCPAPAAARPPACTPLRRPFLGHLRLVPSNRTVFCWKEDAIRRRPARRVKPPAASFRLIERAGLFLELLAVRQREIERLVRQPRRDRGERDHGCDDE